MPQCNFCTRTEDNVPGRMFTKGILGSRICIACAHDILAQTINQQIQRIRILARGHEEANAELKRLKKLAGEEAPDVPDSKS